LAISTQANLTKQLQLGAFIPEIIRNCAESPTMHTKQRARPARCRPAWAEWVMAGFTMSCWVVGAEQQKTMVVARWFRSLGAATDFTMKNRSIGDSCFSQYIRAIAQIYMRNMARPKLPGSVCVEKLCARPS